MDMDQFDFSSAQPVNINLAFQYENLVFEETNVPIREGDGGELIPGMMESTSTFEDFVPAAPKSEESPKITKKDEEPGSEPGGPNDTTSELSPFGPGDGGKPDIGQVTGPKTSDITNKIKAGATKVGSATKSVVKGLNFGL